jgi:hypothetical protein
MKTDRIPNFENRLPQKPKKTAHESGEIFQIYLNKECEKYGERTMAGRNRLQRKP